MSKIKITGRLEGWHQDNLYEFILWGNIFGDSKQRFRDGTRIHTSYIVTPSDEWKEGAVVKTRNSTYLLGTPYKETPVIRAVDPESIDKLKKFYGDN